MTKKETLEQVTKLLSQHKIKETSPLYMELTKMFEPKKAGHSIEFPDILDAKNNIVEKYCGWFKEYRPIEEFAKKGTKGYHYECKEAEKEWQKYAKAIKGLKSDIAALTDDILDEKISIEEGKEKRQALTKEIETLETKRLNKINFEEQ